MLHVPYACLMIAFALIYIPRFVAGAEMKKQAGGYDNNDPRGQQTKLEGRGKRAVAAHQNSIEAFAPFSVGVLACLQLGIATATVQIACVVFVVARVGYILAYLADKATVRSGLWTMGMMCTSALFVLALLGP